MAQFLNRQASWADDGDEGGLLPELPKELQKKMSETRMVDERREQRNEPPREQQQYHYQQQQQQPYQQRHNHSQRTLYQQPRDNSQDARYNNRSNHSGSYHGNNDNNRGIPQTFPTKPPFKIVVKNISFNVSENDLGGVFKECQVSRVDFVTQGGTFRGTAFVEFASAADLENSFKFDSFPLDGRPLYITLYEEKPPRSNNRNSFHNDRNQQGNRRTSHGNQAPNNNTFYQKQQQTQQPAINEPPGERPKLMLRPKSTAVASEGEPSRNTSIFGNAKPRDESKVIKILSKPANAPGRSKSGDGSSNNKDTTKPSGFGDGNGGEKPKRRDTRPNKTGKQPRNNDNNRRDSSDKRKQSNSSRGGKRTSGANIAGKKQESNRTGNRKGSNKTNENKKKSNANNKKEEPKIPASAYKQPSPKTSLKSQNIFAAFGSDSDSD